MNERERKEDILKLNKCPRDFKDALRQQAEKMHHRPLKSWERLLITALVVLSLCGIVVCGILLLTADWVTTAHQRFSLSLGLVFTGASAFWLISILKRGAHRPMADEIPLGVWYFCTAIVCSEIFTGQSEHTILTSIGALVVIGFVMTWERIKASELRVQETILRIALHDSDSRENTAAEPKHAGSSIR